MRVPPGLSMRNASLIALRGRSAWWRAWLKMARSTEWSSMGGAEMSPRRYSRFGRAWSLASLVPNSTIFSDESMAMTFLARWARSCERVPSPAPRSATTS